MSCKRIAGLFAVLLLGDILFKAVNTRSTTGNLTHNVFQLDKTAEQGVVQSLCGVKEWISGSPRGQRALSLSLSQKTTDAPIPANGKLQRGILEGARHRKITHIKTGRPAITKKNDGSKRYSALASSTVNNASRQVATKRLMQFLSNNPRINLKLTEAKGEI